MTMGGFMMERLTYFDGGRWLVKIGDTEHSGQVPDCLAAYEDTGLSPGEVMELARAREDGRLVVLPCKPDDIFFHFWSKDVNIPSVSRFEGVAISEDGEITYPMTRWGEVFTLDDFGKTVFLTSAEAKEALERRKGGQNETD